MVGYLAAQTRAFFFADNLLVNAGFLFGAVWLRDLIVLLASGSGDQWAGDIAPDRRTAAGAHDGAGRHRAARPLRRVVPHQAGPAMNHLDPTELQTAGDRGTLDHRRCAFLVLVGRLLPDPDPPAREVSAARRVEPASPGPAAAAARRDPRPEGRGHRREPAGLHRQAAGATNADSLRAVLSRLATVVPLDSAQIERHRAALARRALPAGGRVRRGVVRDRRAGSRNIARSLPGLVLQSEPRRLYPAGKRGGARGGVRVGSDRRRARRRTAFRARSRDRSSGGPGIEREYDDTLRGPRRRRATSR